MCLANIIEAYSQQYQWRSWSMAFDALPSLEGQVVLDLGCGIGDLSSDLTARGARVIGVDISEGRKLGGVLQGIGMVVGAELTLPDAELSFFGPASPAVLEAWQNRFDRMHLLQKFCGSEYEQVREEFLNCLSRDDHHSQATVRCCIAMKPHSTRSREYDQQLVGRP